MSFNDEYLALRKKRKEAEEKQVVAAPVKPLFVNKTAALYDDDIAPVTKAKTTKAKKKDKEEEERKWFKKGAFEDGYQFGDVTKTILGTAGDVVVGAAKGITRMGEGVADLMLYGDAYIRDKQGLNDLADKRRETAMENWTDDAFDGAESFVDRSSVLGDKADSVSEGLGQVAGILLTGGLGASAGLGTAGVTALTTGVMGVSSMGSGMGEAYLGGATDEEAATYGLIKGIADAGSELIFGGLGKTVKAIGISKGLTSLDDVFAKKLSERITNQVAKNFVEYGVKASAEGVEEILAGVGSAVGKKLTYMSDAELNDLIKDENLFEQFVVGTVTSSIAQSGIVPGMQSGSLVEANKEGRDFISGLSVNEQKVIDKVYKDRVAEAEKDGKVSKKEKSKIYDAVVSDMEKGYISIDTIEEVLGGDTYKAYKDTIDEEDAVAKEFEELGKKQNATLAEQSRYNDLKQVMDSFKKNSAREHLKSQLGEEVFGLVQSDKLLESYNERGRRGQAFEADLTKYDAKQQETIKRAADSGILNNTNRTHEFVDMIAKISADKGVLFDFTNNTKLRESGFAVENKTVNGYVTKDGVTLNIDSAKSLNSVVGHEIAHVLEGTELYDVLQQTIVEYAKSKGDYQGRYDSLTELYKDIEGANVDAELTADLVGDYLFTDPDFINNLSANHRNVFQKIYDEIKYLCKVATAGSKEARELERVKRAFDKAYKEGGKVANTKYSVSDSDYADAVNRGDVETAQKMVDEVAKKAGYNSPKLYHGSDKEYTVFRLSAGQRGGYGSYGLYFADKHTAESYGNTKAYYLKSDKVATIDAGGARATSILTDFVSSGKRGNGVNTHIDDIAAAADERGFDGVVIKNVRDNADESDHVGDVYIVFRPNQIKSADPVTYDDNGNVIPLSERFNEGKQDIRYSISDSDGRQLSKEQREYFKDSKVRDENGSLLKVYHGSKNSGFNVFRYSKDVQTGTDYGEAYYFTSDRQKASGYSYDVTKDERVAQYKKEKDALRDKFLRTRSEEDKNALLNYKLDGKSLYDLMGDESYITEGGEVKEVYLNIINPLIADAGGKYYYEVYPAYFDRAREDGNDGIIVKNVIDNPRGEARPIDTYIAFRPEQIKNTDNLNPTSNPDIRRSLSEEGDAPVYGNYNVSGKDIALEAPAEEVAPIAPVAETETVGDYVTPAEEADTAPVDVSDSAVLKRLNQKLSNSNEELAKNQKLREESAKSFDEKIAQAQAALDARTNKDTKVANALKRRIERLKRLKADRDAEYAKRISDIKARATKAEENIQKYHPGLDRTEKAVARIDKMLEYDKSELSKEYESNKERLKDKDSYISNKASELYDEIRNIKKGVKASSLLGELLDSGHEWSSIRSALVNIKHTPGETVNVNSAAESLAREVLNEDYENSLLNLEEDYAKRINQMEEEAKAKREKATVANQRRTKQEEYAHQMETLVGDTSTWVDKKMGISYRVNTLKRNLRDIVRDANGNRDVAKADAIYDELQGKYNTHEAMLNRDANSIKAAYAEMNITPAEDAYIQMLGEFRHNPDTTLTADAVNEFYEKHKKHIDEAKVDKAIAMARQTYDELLVRVNEVLREQGMKEIPYRKGYFPHFTEEKRSFLAKLFNWKTRNDDIPTDIAGLTEQFNPNRSWQSFNKQRKGDTTDYSFTKGLDTYVQGALDWIYHIEDIQKRRALENHIRYIHSEKGVQEKIDAIRSNEEYDADEAQEQIDLVLKEAGNPLNNFVTDFRAGTNTLANKKSSLDRGMEEMTNRKFYSVMTNISNRVSANMVGGSVSSALTNFIPITQSWGEVSPISSLRAMGDTVRAIYRDDGMVDKSDFLTNRLRKSENLYKTTWDKVSDKVGLMMEGIDNFTSQTVWRSKYLENISNGMSESEAIKNADQFAESVMAGRSRGNMPTIFDSKNPLIKTLTAFQLEVSNQYGYMFKDMPQDMKNESTGKLVKGYAAMFMGAYAYNALFSALTGRDSAFDPIGILEELLRDMGLFGEDDEEEPVDTAMNFAENILQEVPFIGGLMGGGRVPISSAIPYDGNVMDMVEGAGKLLLEGDTSDLTSEWLKPLYYVALPVGGGQIKKTVQGLSMFSDDHPIAGSYTDNGDLRFPVEDTLGNRVKAGLFGQWANKNARDYFDNGRQPLKEKQLQEFIDVDIPIQEYWAYREGLNEQETLEDKFDYIADLDLPVRKKNILINNVVDREDDVDMSKYDDFSSYEEFDFYSKNTEKYEFLQENGVSYEEYIASDDSKEKYNAIWSWYNNNPEKVTVAKSVTSNMVKYREYTGALNDIRADKDSNGKSISGTAKKKKVAYINSLDIDYGARLILFKSEYPADDTYNYEIIDYLNGRDDISYEEMETILKDLGFEVSANGDISW